MQIKLKLCVAVLVFQDNPPPHSSTAIISLTLREPCLRPKQELSFKSLQTCFVKTLCVKSEWVPICNFAGISILLSKHIKF